MRNHLLLCVLLAAPATAQWAQRSPTASPIARTSPGMAYSLFSNSILLFGGYGGSGLGAIQSDTWTYDGATWTQLFPATSPTGKFATALAFDSNRGVFVLYGGNATYTSPGTHETWEFDGVTWTQRFPATNPGNLGLHAMVFDSVRNVTVLYGGMPGGNPITDSNRTWEWDGTNWTQRFPANNPGPLECHAMCFHTGVGKTILFGGVNVQGLPPDSDNTWAYDGTNWSILPIAGTRPLRRERARIAYDLVRGVCVLVGGMHYSNGQPRQDTWELRFDGTTWSWLQAGVTGQPANFYRFDSTLAFLPVQRQMVQFGGLRGSATYLGDTWEYGAKVSSFGAGCAGSNGVPSLTAADAPRLGQTWSVTLSNLPPLSPFALLAMGFSDQVGSFGPLPLPLAGFGMPGCTALVSADATLLVGAAGGSMNWSWAVPGNPAFFGLPLFHQGLAIDPGVNAAGLTASNALRSTLGF